MAHTTSDPPRNEAPRPLPPPPALPPRRVALAWPRRRYVPGAGPHPSADPATASALPDPADVEALVDRGLDLVAGHFVWEAHEAFEAAWRRLPRGPEREALAGLVRLCAAVLRAHAGDAAAARRLIARAEAALAGHAQVRDADIGALVAAVRAWVTARADGRRDATLDLRAAAADAPSGVSP
jgi:hypothetical protein